MQRLYANAVSVPSPTLQRIGEAAAEASVYVVLGVTEETSHRAIVQVQYGF